MKRRYGLETSEPRSENVVSFLGFRFASCTLDVERNKPATWKRQRAQKKSTLFPVSQKPGKRQPRKTKLFGNNCSTPAEPPPREELWPHLHPSHRKQRGELRLPPSPTRHRAGVKENQVGSGDFSPVRCGGNGVPPPSVCQRRPLGERGACTSAPPGSNVTPTCLHWRGVGERGSEEA